MRMSRFAQDFSFPQGGKPVCFQGFPTLSGMEKTNKDVPSEFISAYLSVAHDSSGSISKANGKELTEIHGLAVSAAEHYSWVNAIGIRLRITAKAAQGFPKGLHTGF